MLLNAAHRQMWFASYYMLLKAVGSWAIKRQAGHKDMHVRLISYCKLGV